MTIRGSGATDNLSGVNTHEKHSLAQSRWEKFAQEDPYTYICTEVARGDQQTFWKGGERVVSDELLPLIHRFQGRMGTALELGCGVGRLLFPMSRHFSKVVGLDISSEMVRLGKELASKNSVGNAEFIHIVNPYALVQQLSRLGDTIDFAYSLLVFQHIDFMPIIEAYVETISFLLAPEGIAYLQFDTRGKDLFYQTKMMLPDFVLPRFLRRGIRRVRRDPVELEAMFSKAGLQLVNSIGPSTNYHRYVLRRNAA